MPKIEMRYTTLGKSKTEVSRLCFGTYTLLQKCDPLGAIKLIGKAVGWMLREVGKKDLSSLKNFLKRHRGEMPRTALRYAIERFPEGERRTWLDGRF